jgi:molybdopterin synthase catalytic subunit
MASRVQIQSADFDIASEAAALRAGDGGVGALALFVGTVRDRHGDSSPGQIRALELEHYPGMTERSIESMIDQAVARFGLRAVRVIHRIGRLQPMEQIVMVAVTAAHRHAALDGCAFLMDYLKTQAPFWKKEWTPQGERWVDARVDDDEALGRWGIESVNNR